MTGTRKCATSPFLILELEVDRLKRLAAELLLDK